MFVPYTDTVIQLRENKDYLAYGLARREQVVSFVGPLKYEFVLEDIGNIRSHPEHPCAKYPEVKRLALQFKTLWGDKQLEQDAKRVNELTNKDR